jgi:predicted dienelactone hydrolase
MTYDPFARGPHPVGVRTVEVHTTDAQDDDRVLPTEVWYPATEEQAGRDLDDATCDHYEQLPGMPPSTQHAVRDADPAAGQHTPVVFSHGFAGHRRQTTHLCTHLASHGYVVASPDHVGNTLPDMLPLFAERPDAARSVALFAQVAVQRPPDLLAALQVLVDGIDGVPAAVDGPAGMAGHSFGGWTALEVTGRDPRIGATLALAPGGGDPGTIEGVDLRDSLNLDWGRDVPTLVLAADGDSLLGPDGMRALLPRLHGATGLAILRDADHWHFCDDVESVHGFMYLMRDTLQLPDLQPVDQLTSGAAAAAFIDGLGLAHLDAHLRRDPGAATFLAGDLVEILADRGVAIELVRP